MKLVIDSDLALTESAVFYRYSEESINNLRRAFSRSDVLSLFRFIREKKSISRLEPGQVVKREISTDGRTLHVSFCWFRFEPEVPFLIDSHVKESRYGYLLIIETSNIVAICKSNAPDPWPIIKNKVKKVPHTELSSFYSNADPDYEKLSLRTMTVATSEIRKKSFEAYDLKGIIPSLGAGREVPVGFKIHVHNNGIYAITPGSGRIVRASGKTDLNSLCSWILTVEEELSRKFQSGGFLSQFAQATEFSEVGKLNATSVLFDFGHLNDLVANGEIDFLLNDVEIPKKRVDLYLNRCRRLITLSTCEERGSRAFVYKNPNKSIVKFKENLQAFGIEFPLFRKLQMKTLVDGEAWTLAKWLKMKDHFSLAFDDVRYFYTDGKLFFNQGILAEMDSVLQILEPTLPPDIDSEKGGKPESYKNIPDTQFRENSLFRFVDDELTSSAHGVFCDDLGDEWADHIAITDSSGTSQPTIEFLHSKHGKITNGASCFQEVIGQALKNLGRLYANQNDLEAKLRRATQYWNQKNNTRIKRIRNEINLEDFIQLFSKIISHPNAARKVTLVASFMSEKGFQNAIQAKTLKPHTIQLVWQLSAFVNACRQMGIRARIVCKP